MPASIAHMVIVHKAFELLRTRGFDGLAAFASTIDDPEQRKKRDYWKYMNLGSLGPDLYYYASMMQSGKEMLLEGYVQAAGVTPWSYQLHSCKPGNFPFHLAEILFRDAVWKNDQVQFNGDDMRKLAYIAGHLSHIAADQIIHPVVNDIAKPYYRDGKNRKKHRECEVYQDYFLYEEVYRDKRDQAKGRSRTKYDFFEQDFRTWVDCIGGLTTRNTHDWFRYFLQRGFVETYGTGPTEDEIENSVDNLLLILRVCKIRGPYKDAQADYERYGADSAMYQEYIAGPDYGSYYRQGVRLSAAYIAALYEIYAILAAGSDFEDPGRRRFFDIVSNADLSCPLERNILDKARDALIGGEGGQKYAPLFED